jgi:hypothetical protein
MLLLAESRSAVSTPQRRRVPDARLLHCAVSGLTGGYLVHPAGDEQPNRRTVRSTPIEIVTWTLPLGMEPGELLGDDRCVWAQHGRVGEEPHPKGGVVGKTRPSRFAVPPPGCGREMGAGERETVRNSANR